MALALLVLGLAIGGSGTIWLAILAFRDSVLWGVGCLLLPPVPLAYAMLHWPESWRPFVMAIAGGVLAGVGAVLLTPQVIGLR